MRDLRDWEKQRKGERDTEKENFLCVHACGCLFVCENERERDEGPEVKEERNRERGRGRER